MLSPLATPAVLLAVTRILTHRLDTNRLGLGTVSQGRIGKVNSQDNQESLAVLAAAERRLAQCSDFVEPLTKSFASRGYPLYLVGGPVRDAFLGRSGHDLDMTTPARPEVIAELLKSFAPSVWDTGIEFGTVSADKDGTQVEITTFRSDTYDGHSRNPEVRFGDSLVGDLLRRDFTVNAMAVELSVDGSLKLHDPMGGFEHLRAGILDTPASPEQSFEDDPLRMLRAARFASQLNFQVADRVQKAMRTMAGEIQRITAERIREELDRLMLGAHPEVGINLLVDTGLADYVLPEIPAMKLTQDEHHQHKDVYAHSLKVLQQAMELEEGEPDLILRWSALLHDVGKPDTRCFGDNGKVSFHHHEVVGAKLVRKRFRALKYPKATIQDISQLVYLHMRFHGFGEGQWTDSAVRRYVTDAGELLERLNKLVRADCTTRNQRKARRLQRAYEDLERRIALLKEKEDLAALRPELDGNEIMQILGLTPGPDVGRAWKYLKELRIERGPMNHDDAVAALQEWWEENK